MSRRKLPKGWTIRDGLLTMKDPVRDRRATAIHEAGHAVVSELVRERVQRVGLTSRYLRNSSYTGLRGFCNTLYSKQHGRIDPIHRAVIALAGHEAEVYLCARPVTLLPLEDLQVIRRLGCSDDSVALAGQISRRYVRWNAKDIRRVAREILKYQMLSRRQFLKAYRDVT